MDEIIVKQAGVRYGHLHAVEDVSFAVQKGSYTCLVGPNGSGKSTLIKAIAGLLPLSGGQIELSVPRDRISYLSQINKAERDFPATVREIVLTGTQKNGRRVPFYTQKDKQAADDALRQLSIEAFSGKRIGTLSGGQQQRVLIARALCREPLILLLDEPCAGLDPKIAGEFYSLIADLNASRGISILMASHDLQEVARYASHIAVMEGSHLTFFGTVRQWQENTPTT